MGPLWPTFPAFRFHLVARGVCLGLWLRLCGDSFALLSYTYPSEEASTVLGFHTALQISGPEFLLTLPMVPILFLFLRCFFLCIKVGVSCVLL